MDDDAFVVRDCTQDHYYARVENKTILCGSLIATCIPEKVMARRRCFELIQDHPTSGDIHEICSIVLGFVPFPHQMYKFVVPVKITITVDDDQVSFTPLSDLEAYFEGYENDSVTIVKGDQDKEVDFKFLLDYANLVDIDAIKFERQSSFLDSLKFRMCCV